VGFEPERDRFFQYATFLVVAMTGVVCACYALLYLNPRVNPFEGTRPLTPTQDLSIAALPATWTPTATDTATTTPTATWTFTPTPTFTDTPTDTPIPTDTATPTIYYIIIPGATSTPRPTRIPTRPPTEIPPTLVPTPAPQPFDFHLGRAVDVAPNCGSWYVSGTVYSDSSGSGRLNGILVRVWAFDIEQGTDTTGIHGNRPGYWEWHFGKGTNVQGQVAIVNPDGSLRSSKVSFQLTSNCNADGAVQQAVIDFVGGP
jgi:hypothetical protein